MSLGTAVSTLPPNWAFLLDLDARSPVARRVLLWSSMLKPSLTKSALVIAVLATPALAGGSKPLPKRAPAPKVIKTVAAVAADADEIAPAAKKSVESYDLGKTAIGDSYDVLKPGRRTALPGEAEMVIVPRSLTQIQVGEVVKEKRAELDYCWQRVAVLDRMPSTALLKLKVDASGNVTSLAIGGDAPAVVNACLKECVPHWTFPETETKSEVAYPVAFRSL